MVERAGGWYCRICNWEGDIEQEVGMTTNLKNDTSQLLTSVIEVLLPKRFATFRGSNSD